MKNYIILTEKPWHQKILGCLEEKFPEYRWILLNNRNDFTSEFLQDIQPEKIFIPHWSYIIPKDIYSCYECVVFHMTDLPFGRGGSPLQNLITKGYDETKISAIRVEKGLDTGPVFLKRNLNLSGTAQEIFLRSTPIIEEMIIEIIEKKLKPVAQKGKPVNFKRRSPEDGELANIKDISTLYDFIRMLDCEGYPNAFLENQNFRFEFSRATLKSHKEIIADVRIIKK